MASRETRSSVCKQVGDSKVLDKSTDVPEVRKENCKHSDPACDVELKKPTGRARARKTTETVDDSSEIRNSLLSRNSARFRSASLPPVSREPSSPKAQRKLRTVKVCPQQNGVKSYISPYKTRSDSPLVLRSGKQRSSILFKGDSIPLEYRLSRRKTTSAAKDKSPGEDTASVISKLDSPAVIESDCDSPNTDLSARSVNDLETEAKMPVLCSADIKSEDGSLQETRSEGDQSEVNRDANLGQSMSHKISALIKRGQVSQILQQISRAREERRAQVSESGVDIHKENCGQKNMKDTNSNFCAGVENSSNSGNYSGLMKMNTFAKETLSGDSKLTASKTKESKDVFPPALFYKKEDIKSEGIVLKTSGKMFLVNSVRELSRDLQKSGKLDTSKVVITESAKNEESGKAKSVSVKQEIDPADSTVSVGNSASESTPLMKEIDQSFEEVLERLEKCVNDNYQLQLSDSSISEASPITSVKSNRNKTLEKDVEIEPDDATSSNPIPVKMEPKNELVTSCSDASVNDNSGNKVGRVTVKVEHDDCGFNNNVPNTDFTLVEPKIEQLNDESELTDAPNDKSKVRRSARSSAHKAKALLCSKKSKHQSPQCTDDEASNSGNTLESNSPDTSSKNLRLKSKTTVTNKKRTSDTTPTKLDVSKDSSVSEESLNSVDVSEVVSTENSLKASSKEKLDEKLVSNTPTKKVISVKQEPTSANGPESVSEVKRDLRRRENNSETEKPKAVSKESVESLTAAHSLTRKAKKMPLKKDKFMKTVNTNVVTRRGKQCLVTVNVKKQKITKKTVVKATGVVNRREKKIQSMKKSRNDDVQNLKQPRKQNSVAQKLKGIMQSEVKKRRRVEYGAEKTVDVRKHAESRNPGNEKVVVNAEGVGRNQEKKEGNETMESETVDKNKEEPGKEICVAENKGSDSDKTFVVNEDEKVEDVSVTMELVQEKEEILKNDGVDLGDLMSVKENKGKKKTEERTKEESPETPKNEISRRESLRKRAVEKEKKLEDEERNKSKEVTEREREEEENRRKNLVDEEKEDNTNIQKIALECESNTVALERKIEREECTEKEVDNPATKMISGNNDVDLSLKDAKEQVSSSENQSEAGNNSGIVTQGGKEGVNKMLSLVSVSKNEKNSENDSVMHQTLKENESYMRTVEKDEMESKIESAVKKGKEVEGNSQETVKERANDCNLKNVVNVEIMAKKNGSHVGKCEELNEKCGINGTALNQIDESETKWIGLRNPNPIADEGGPLAVASPSEKNVMKTSPEIDNCVKPGTVINLISNDLLEEGNLDSEINASNMLQKTVGDGNDVELSVKTEVVDEIINAEPELDVDRGHEPSTVLMSISPFEKVISEAEKGNIAVEPEKDPEKNLPTERVTDSSDVKNVLDSGVDVPVEKMVSTENTAKAVEEREEVVERVESRKRKLSEKAEELEPCKVSRTDFSSCSSSTVRSELSEELSLTKDGNAVKMEVESLSSGVTVTSDDTKRPSSVQNDDSVCIDAEDVEDGCIDTKDAMAVQSAGEDAELPSADLNLKTEENELMELNKSEETGALISSQNLGIKSTLSVDTSERRNEDESENGDGGESEDSSKESLSKKANSEQITSKGERYISVQNSLKTPIYSGEDGDYEEIEKYEQDLDEDIDVESEAPVQCGSHKEDICGEKSQSSSGVSTDGQLSPEDPSIKEPFLSALGLGPRAKVLDGREHAYTGTLKTVIKVHRSPEKRGSKFRFMVKNRGNSSSANGCDGLDRCEMDVAGNGTAEKVEYRIHRENNAELDPAVTDLTNLGIGNRKCLKPFTFRSYFDLSTNSPFLKENAAIPEVGDKTGNKEDGKAHSNKTGENLVIPEKSSSFSIHPGRLCSDVCSYCFGKFGSLDTPCHIAQLKNTERQQKILTAESHLTADSCLCDACYRHVDRKANCPSYNASGTRKRMQRSGSASHTQCCSTGCTQPAVHQVRRKWMVKLKRVISKKVPVDMDKSALHQPFPLCSQHYFWVEHYMQCAMCKRRLSINHMYHLGPEVHELNRALSNVSIPISLAEKVFVCKLCRYFCQLCLKYKEQQALTSCNRLFCEDYRKKILYQNDIETENDSKAQNFLPPKNKKRKTKSLTATSDGEGKAEKGDKSEKDKDANSLATIVPPIVVLDGGDASNSTDSTDYSRAGASTPTIDYSSLAYPSTSVDILSNTVADPIPGSSKLKMPRVRVKVGNTTLDPATEIHPVFSPPAESAVSDQFQMQASFDFRSPYQPGSRKRKGDWEMCNATLQFTKETKKDFMNLQRPYGNYSSFIRHLVLLEKYWRSGDLVLSSGASSRAHSYISSIETRIKSLDGSMKAPSLLQPSPAPYVPPALPMVTPSVSVLPLPPLLPVVQTQPSVSVPLPPPPPPTPLPPPPPPPPPPPVTFIELPLRRSTPTSTMTTTTTTSVKPVTISAVPMTLSPTMPPSTLSPTTARANSKAAGKNKHVPNIIQVTTTGGKTYPVYKAFSLQQIKALQQHKKQLQQQQQHERAQQVLKQQQQQQQQQLQLQAQTQASQHVQSMAQLSIPQTQTSSSSVSADNPVDSDFVPLIGNVWSMAPENGSKMWEKNEVDIISEKKSSPKTVVPRQAAQTNASPKVSVTILPKRPPSSKSVGRSTQLVNIAPKPVAVMTSTGILLSRNSEISVSSVSVRREDSPNC